MHQGGRDSIIFTAIISISLFVAVVVGPKLGANLVQISSGQLDFRVGDHEALSKLTGFLIVFVVLGIIGKILCSTLIPNNSQRSWSVQNQIMGLCVGLLQGIFVVASTMVVVVRVTEGATRVVASTTYFLVFHSPVDILALLNWFYDRLF